MVSQTQAYAIKNQIDGSIDSPGLLFILILLVDLLNPFRNGTHLKIDTNEKQLQHEQFFFL